MSKSKAISRPFEQTAQQRAELEALRRMLDLSEGTFSLSVAVCNSPALRDHIIEHVTGEVEGIQVVRVPEDARDIFDLVRQQIPNGSPRAIFVADLEKALAEDKRSRVVQGLNVSREQWQSAFQCPVVFWLPEYAQSLLMTQARDLWSWISHNFEFVSEQATAPAGMQDSYAGNITLASNLDVHEKRFRIAELEQRIADAGEEPQGQLREHMSVWQNELAYLRRSLGDLDGAMALYKEQERICRQLGNLNGLQASLGNQALILQDRGDLDGAMALYKEQERICRQLGNLNGLQASLGNQALILQDRGDLDGAMALYKEQERICRQLGNVEGLATLLANQASALHQMGHMREALPLAEESYELASKHGYAMLGKQIEPFLSEVREAAEKAYRQ